MAVQPFPRNAVILAAQLRAGCPRSQKGVNGYGKPVGYLFFDPFGRVHLIIKAGINQTRAGFHVEEISRRYTY